MKTKLIKILGLATLLALVSSLLLSFFAYEVPVPLFYANFLLVGASFIYYTISQKMILFVIKRIVGAFGVILIIASLTFLLMRTMPGGPFDEEKTLPPEIKANIEAKYNLNAPLYEQYIDYMGGLLKGDLGQSYKYLGRNVSDIIGEVFPASFQLGLYALIISFLLGIPLGLLAAAYHNKWQDTLSMMIAILGVALPSFLVAPVLIQMFSFGWPHLPAALWDGPSYYLLPMIVLGTRPAATIARLTRASVLEVIRSDYIRTAKAKGLSRKTVLFKHVLRNSLIPVLTYAGPLIASILSGTFVIELIFAIPGMGKHLIQSVSNRDYPLILATTLLFSALLVFANLIVDLLYSYFDPRIRLS